MAVCNDSQIDEAEYEVQQVRNKGYKDVTLLKIYSDRTWYVTTVGHFPSESAAESASIDLRANIRPSAYVIRLGAVCPKPVEGTRYVDCPK